MTRFPTPAALAALAVTLLAGCGGGSSPGPGATPTPTPTPTPVPGLSPDIRSIDPRRMATSINTTIDVLVDGVTADQAENATVTIGGVPQFVPTRTYLPSANRALFRFGPNTNGLANNIDHPVRVTLPAASGAGTVEAARDATDTFGRFDPGA